MTILFFDLDLDPMTLILKTDIDMVKLQQYTENEVPSWSGWKIIAWTGRHRWKTDRQTDPNEIIIYPHMRMVIAIITDAFCYSGKIVIRRGQHYVISIVVVPWRQ